MAERSALSSAVCYRDPKAALKFLEAAFGFDLVMLIEDDQGDLVHSEMAFGDALIMIGNEWSDDHKSPASIGGKNTQTVHIHIETDCDAHCERARAAGFEILMAPETQFYGDRTYRCRDPEGHIWTIGQAVQAVSREEAEAATGLKIEGWILMAAFDLESTYLSLDGEGRVARHPVEGFWESIDSNPDILSTLVAAFASTEDWPHWEMHPGGEEVLILIDGRMTMILDEPGGERRVEMTPGSTCIVPTGVWHRALVPEASRFIGLTYGAGTTHRPL